MCKAAGSYFPAALPLFYGKIIENQQKLWYNQKKTESVYNMNCKITICGADGKIFTSFGSLEYTDVGFDIDYSIDGDRCVLSSRGTTVTQSRRGAVNNDITFSENSETVCMLLSGELTGSIPVKTVELYVERTEKGAAVKIIYFLGGGKIRLNLSAELL